MKIAIRNKSAKTFRVMLEPITFSEDVAPGKALTIENVTEEDMLIIDISDEILLSVWADPHATFVLD